MDPDLQETLMFAFIIVLGLGLATAGILGCIAYFRGRLRLNSDPADEKVVFVLMNKKVGMRPDMKYATPEVKNADPVEQPVPTPDVKKG